MTENTIKHLRSRTSSMVFDCLFVDRDEGNSDTFVLIVTETMSANPRQSIMEIVGNWELYELLGLFKKLDEARPLENGKGKKIDQNWKESGVPDADMSVSLKRKRKGDMWALDVSFNPAGSQGSFAASHGSEQKDTNHKKPFFRVEFNNENDVHDTMRFLRDPFAAKQFAAYPLLEGQEFSIADTHQMLIERFGVNPENNYLVKAMETFMERVKKADL